ncbi:endo alpha-1,4 polygalactosaminidase [Gramella sp. Hel_I_59]|uniref:endo alpha-1,4 polygalactosaminidase n=1 Tax=Gramella sp. Hel_I_59 TaxID=1249978 RepID=UPI001151B44D|nr:endo alpha-1,4 polygalactosaminidase [Gramella sp. Hel_I_59]
MQHIKYFVMGLVCFSIFSFSKCKHETGKRVLVNYGDFDPELVKGYDYVILESAHFSSEDIKILKSNNQNVLAYVSFGEVNEAAPHYQEISEYTLSKNDIWNSYVLDLENEQTRQTIFEIVRNNLETKGFDGLFLDNIDNYTSFGPTPEKLTSLVSFLKLVKAEFPKSHLMQNAGLEALDETEEYVSSIAVESVATNYNFETSEYRMRESKDFNQRIDNLKSVAQDIGLPIIIIEYADSATLKNAVKKRLKPYQANLFIGKIELQNLPENE